MSQPPYPPPPPFPPNQYPPQYPSPYASQYIPPQPPRGNAAAVVSLVTGILLCVPLAWIAALICGVIGLRKTSDPAVGGRGSSIAGIVLGALGLVLQGIVLIVFLIGARAVSRAMNTPAHAVAVQFATDLAGGDVSKVAADCDDGVDSKQIVDEVDTAKSWGAFRRALLLPQGRFNDSGDGPASFKGVVFYANGPENMTLTISHPKTDPKVSNFIITH